MKNVFVAVLLTGMTASAVAQSGLSIPMNFVDDNGIAASAGQIAVVESKYGLVLTPALAGLSPGLHGFQNSCLYSCSCEGSSIRYTSV